MRWSELGFATGWIYSMVREMKLIKRNEKLYYERKLDSPNPKSQKQGFYSTNIWQEMNNHYTKDK